MLAWDGGQDGEPTVGEKLSQVQKKELEELLSRHRDTLTKIPVCTNLASHSIETGPTVSPVEKLTNRTTGTLPVRSRYGHGTDEVRSRYGRGASGTL